MSQCKENDNYYLLCLIKCTNMLSKASRNFFEKKNMVPFTCPFKVKLWNNIK